MCACVPVCACVCVVIGVRQVSQAELQRLVERLAEERTELESQLHCAEQELAVALAERDELVKQFITRSSSTKW